MTITKKKENQEEKEFYPSICSFIDRDEKSYAGENNITYNVDVQTVDFPINTKWTMTSSLKF